jgi:hypothetical protein
MLRLNERLAFVETCDGFTVYSKDVSQDLFTVLLKAGPDNECIASGNSGQRRAGNLGWEELRKIQTRHRATVIETQIMGVFEEM